MEVRFHGHACVELVDGEHRVVVDPFLAPNNPKADVSADELEATHILLTHGHADHFADALPLASRTGAPVLALTELANWLSSKGLERVSNPNLGGTVQTEFGWVKVVQALHTNTVRSGEGDGQETFVIGPPAGLVINLGGTTVYHLGDTALFSDLRLIAERTPVDVALIPIGGHFTMDRHDAVVAADLIGAATVIPIHYDTFPLIETDSQAFKSEAEKQTRSKVVLLKPGETHTADA